MFSVSSFSDLKNPYQQTSSCMRWCLFFIVLCLFYWNSAVIYTGLFLLKQMINISVNNSHSCFCRTKPNDTALSETVMHTDVDINVIGNVMTQQQPACLHLLNGSAVSGFSVGAAESITLPLMWTHSVLPFFHVGRAGNKRTVAWLPAPWPSQVNHLALLCNTDHHNHYCVASTMPP